MNDETETQEQNSIFNQPEEAPSEFSNRTLLLSAGGFLLMLTALYWLVQVVGLRELQLMIASAGIWGPFVFVGIKALTFTFAPLSAGPIQFASGLLFGLIPGTFYSVLGEVIGGTINVVIARMFGRRIVMRFVGKAGLKRIDAFYRDHLDDWQSLLAARLLLFSVYDFISYGVGLGHIRLSVYILVSFFGGLLPTFIFVFIGSEVAQNQELLLMFYVGAALLFVFFVIFRRLITRLFEKIFD